MESHQIYLHTCHKLLQWNNDQQAAAVIKNDLLYNTGTKCHWDLALGLRIFC